MNDVERLAQDLIRGLSQEQKTISSAWFYDDEGSRLFQRIMSLPEYYLTRLEHQLLRERVQDLAQWIDPDAQPFDLIELGSGDGAKTLSLCQVLQQRESAFVYRPMDVSAHAMAELQGRFAQQLPGLALAPVLGNYFEQWPPAASGRRQVAMLLGSNLGNLDEAQALALLRRIHAQLRPGDTLLLGLDLVKDPHVLRAAYADALGVTAEFNLNLLRRLNRELGMNFDLQQFSHYASYCPLQAAARSFLVSRCNQRVSSRLLDREFFFREGETIYTEQSQKYSLPAIERMAQQSGFHPAAVLTDPRAWYALAVWQKR